MADTNTTNDTPAELLQQALEAEQKKVEELQRTQEALIQEFSTAGTYAEQLEIAKKAIKDILPRAIETMNELIIGGESEGVRASLSKYVVDSVLSGKLDKDADGEVAGMLKRLAENGENIPQQVVNG